MTPDLSGERVLVTGAAGSIGAAIVERLLRTVGDGTVIGTDIEASLGVLAMDIRRPDYVAGRIKQWRPTVILHLAGAKHAPLGEEDPYGVAMTNVDGTWNVLCQAHLHAPLARVVTASTCKAADPETVYGATKLIAERMTLAAGGSVARFYNVRESSGNVFETWRNLPADAPIPVTNCSRYFISIEQAVALVLWTAVLPSGRYTVEPGAPQEMADVARDMYPRRRREPMAVRRGDRFVEPMLAIHEGMSPVPGAPDIWRIHSRYDDPAPRAEMEAA